MSSRRRLYLNLKQSVTKLFKTSAHYLKEITGKHSLFEKPYFEGGYREMQLKLSNPSWSTPKADPGFGPGLGFGPGPGRWPLPRKHTFIFDDGICGLSGRSGECGEVITLYGWIGATPPGSREKGFSWIAGSTYKKGAQVIGIDTSLGGFSAAIHVKLGDDFTGTVTVCASAAMIEGSFLAEIAFEVPSQLGGVRVTPGWIPSLEYAMGNLSMLYETRRSSGTWDCGCVDLDVVCLCEGAVWDDANSADTVAASSSCSVAIKDGTGGERTWSVSGTGAWLDGAFTITSLTNESDSATIFTDADACGPITVSACGASGVVRCTAGEWVLIDSSSCCGGSTGGACNNTEIVGEFKYYCIFVGVCYTPVPCSGCHNTPCLPVCYAQDTSQWSCP